MSHKAIEFDYPPPIKPQKIRLVLPGEEELCDVEKTDDAPAPSKHDSSYDLSVHDLGESAGITSRESELNELELALIEREEAVKHAEARLFERERSLWEFEALILAREKLLRGQQEMQKTTSVGNCGEAMQELLKLKAEIARQQENLEQSKKELMERQEFVEASEERLLEKTMQQQEEESRLEQIKEDLDARELRVNQLEGKPPPPQVPKEVL